MGYSCKLKPSLTIHGTLFDVFIPEKDLDVTAVRVARTVHVVEWNGNPNLSSPSRVRF